MKRKTTVEFINEAKNVHFDKDYDYSFVDYINNETKVDIYCNVCKKHFFQRPNDHLCGRGCPSCNILSTEIFINRSNYIHNYYYDYSLTIYKNNKTKVKIICPKHGIFEPRADDHMNGHICKKCSDEKFIKTTDYFICKAIEKHGIFYIYSKTKYINAKENVIITCP